MYVESPDLYAFLISLEKFLISLVQSVNYFIYIYCRAESDPRSGGESDPTPRGTL